MMKKSLCILLAFSLLCSMLIVSFSAAEIDKTELGADLELSETSVPSESQFLSSISTLRNTYVNGQYWNKYSSSDYSKTGNIACNGISYSKTHYGMSCSSVGYCDYCSCECGSFAGCYQCMAFAYKMAYLSLGSYPGQNEWTQSKTLETVYAGDVIRIRNDSHSIFIYKVDGNNIYYADCNWTGPCQVRWGAKYTYSELSSVFSYKWHLSGNNLTGTGTHTHNYNTYVYYWAAHPHYSCYKCSCGEVKENRNETRPIDTCAQCIADYKPNASIDKDIYHLEENVTVSWDKINNATHYNVRLYKVGEDGNGKLYNTTYNITDTSYTFSSLVPGDYYLYVQTYNKYYWMSDNSDYFHSQGDKLSFSVIDENHPTATTQYGSSYYEYYNYQMSWLEALKFCERRGGHLAVINSPEENDVVYHLAKSYSTYAWLGGTDDGKEGNWYWINSDSFSYTNWNPGEPNNDGSGENCLELMTSDNHPGQWNDVPYNSTRVMGFICEYENNRAIDLTKYQPIITQENNGKKYEVYNNPVDWQTAKLICERKGGHLIVIDDANESTFIEKLISSCDKDEYWLGVSDYMDEGNWITVLGEKVQFSNWTNGEPSNSSNVEDYAVIKKNSYWNDLKEYSGLYRSVGFICEYEPITVILGDADGDGEVGVSDATIIQRRLTNTSVPFPEETLMNADVDSDSELTILDATFIQRHIAKISVPYPIGEPKA